MKSRGIALNPNGADDESISFGESKTVEEKNAGRGKANFMSAARNASNLRGQASDWDQWEQPDSKWVQQAWGDNTSEITEEAQGSWGPVQWQEHFSDEGQTFYFRPDTGESSWSLPTSSYDEIQILAQYQDAEGRWYWYNNSTGETTWS